MFITGYTGKRTCTEQCSMAFFERKTMKNRVHLWDLRKLWIISFGKMLRNFLASSFCFQFI